MSQITGNNHTYTASELIGAPGYQIYRSALGGASTDTFPTTTTLMVAEYGVASADFDDESYTQSITNNGSSTITQELGTGQSLIPADFAGSYTAGTITGGSGYTTSAGVVGTGADSGATMNLDFTAAAGAITSIDAINSITAGSFIAGEEVNVAGGTGGSFTLIVHDTILAGQARLYEFVVVDGSVPTMNVIIRSSNSAETSGIAMPSGDILVGDASGQGAAVTMSSEGTVDNTGAFTLGSSIAGATTFANGTSSTTPATGALIVTGGLGIGENVNATGDITTAAGTVSGASVTDGTATLNSGTLSGLVLPTAGDHATNKTYVDSLVNGLSWKETVIMATTSGDMTQNSGSTYDLSGADGLDTITWGAGAPTIDGVTPIVGDRVLVKNDATIAGTGAVVDSQGLYEVTVVNPLELTRTTDALGAGGPAENASGTAVLVQEGTAAQDTGWVVTTDDADFGTDITYTQFSGSGIGITSINGESGPAITMAVGTTGTDFNVAAAANTITYNLPDASATARGAVTTAAQTFAGNKTFNGDVITASTSSIVMNGSTSGTMTLDASTSAITNFSIVFPADVGATGQVLESTVVGTVATLDWVTPSSGPLSYWYGYGPTASVPVTNTATIVNIPQSVEGGASDYTDSGGVITINTTGDYRISYWVQFQTQNQSGGQRASFGGQIFLDPLGVGSPALVAGTTSECYVREQNSTLIRPGCGKEVILSLTATDEIEVRVLRTIGTTTGQTRIDESTLSIERLS